MEISVLGGIELTDRGERVGLDRPKERMLLAALVLDRPAPVAEERLIDALWPVDTPRTARKTLQNHVLRLRRVLGAGAIATTERGYVLDAADLVVDADRLDSAVRVAARSGSADCASLAVSLAGWRGEPYDDLADWEPAQIEARRLGELRDLGEELLVDARLTDGDHALLVPDLEAMVSRRPLRERRWEQLMLALYRCGRQADALRAFARSVGVLAREVGASPGPGLAAMERAVLRRDAMLDGPARPVGDEVDRRRAASASVAASDAAARAAALEALAAAQRRAGDRDLRDTLLAAAEARREADQADEALRDAVAASRLGGMGAVVGGVDSGRVAAIEAALASSSNGSDRTRAMASLAVELSYVAPVERRRALLDEALERARRDADPTVLVDVLLRRVQGLAGPDRTRDADAEAAECLELAAALDDPARTWAAACARANLALRLGDTAAADRALAVAHVALADTVTPGMRYLTLVRSAARELLAGRLGPTERLADEAVGIGLATAQPDALDVYGQQLLHIRHEQGRFDEIAGAVAEVDLERPHPLPAPIVAWAAALLGETQRAQDALERALDRAGSLGNDELRLVALTYTALAAAELGDADAARQLLPLVAPYRGQYANTGAVVLPVIDHVCGVLAFTLGDHRAAAADLAQAIEQHRQAPAPLLLAATEQAQARLTASGA